MKLDEVKYLIDNLTEECEVAGKDPSKVEVRIAIQPSYPLQCYFRGVATPEAINEEYKERKGKDYETEENTIFIVADQCSDRPYAPRNCWDVIRTE